VTAPTSTAPDALRRAPVVHAAWTVAWFRGEPALATLFGPPPSPASLSASAATQAARAAIPWTSWAQAAPGHAPPPEALVVLAGQQPVLAGGAALVAHKTATAIRLARDLARSLGRPVVPVFLLADEDHDSAEVDHVDVFDEATGALRRVRCPISPRSARFSEAAWDRDRLPQAVREIATVPERYRGAFEERCGLLEPAPAASHVAALLLDVFGDQGLVCVESHRLTAAGGAVVEAALGDPGWSARQLAAGAERLGRAGLRVSFDPEDPRPLVLESRDLRRRRVAAGDGQALRRFAARPDSFSPQAALRPVVQAAALPVVAQVCGPSELLYLGQARALHERFGLAAPVLVPRLEATRLTVRQLRELGGDLTGVDLVDASRLAHPLAEPERALAEAAARLAEAVTAASPALAGRARRWRERAERTARRLAEAPHWHARRGSAAAVLRPRGRAQDTVLAWLPDAWHAGRPAAWGARLVELCSPLEAPEHVLHVLPEESHG
jgi:hypothetical protein